MTDLLDLIFNPPHGPCEPMTMDLEVCELQEGDVIDFIDWDWGGTDRYKALVHKVSGYKDKRRRSYTLYLTLIETGKRRVVHEFYDTVSRGVIRH